MCNNNIGKTSTNVPLSIAMLVHYGLLAGRSPKKNFRLVQLAGCEGLPWPWPGPHKGGACFQLARQQLLIHSEKNHYSHCDHQRQADGLWMILIYLYYDHFERKRGDGKLISYWTWSQKKNSHGVISWSRHALKPIPNALQLFGLESWL